MSEAWIDNLDRVLAANERIANEGSQILSDKKFVDELTGSLSDMDASAKELANIQPPTDDTKIMQEKAEELYSQTQIFTSSYKLGLLGNEPSMDLAISTLDELVVIYTDIANILEQGIHVTPP